MNDIYIIASGLWVVVSFMWLMKLEIDLQAPVDFEMLSDRCREILTSRTVRLRLKEPVPSFDEWYQITGYKTHEDVSLQEAINLIVEHCGIALEVTPATKETMKIVKKPRSKK